MLEHDSGALCAPTAFDRTVTATALIAELEALPPDALRVILATGKLVGEGFDHPALLRMLNKRQAGYRAMGYRLADPSSSMELLSRRVSQPFVSELRLLVT
ncbi:hypothetical protein D9M69_556820 [compost metagenome]